MQTKLLSKALAVAVIILFLGLAIQPSVAVQQEKEIDIEPKNYLFQTIIDIANNPDVKELFEQYKPYLFEFDIDSSVYRKIFFRNPRLMFNMLFTKPSITYDYFDKSYKNGIEIINTLGKDELLEMIESVEISEMVFIDEINNIISKNEELSGRLATLKKMNKGYVSDLQWDFPIICTLVEILFFPIGLLLFIYLTGWVFMDWGFFYPKLNIIITILALILSIPFIILLTIGQALDCNLFGIKRFPY